VKPIYSTTSSILGVSGLILSALNSAAQNSPLPGLQQASSLALLILNTIGGAADNKQLFKRLANDACKLVYSVVHLHEEMESRDQKLSPRLMQDLQGLVETLEHISSFASAHAARNTIQRIISRPSDVQKIQEYRETLRQALDVFGLQSSITIRETVTRIAERQASFHDELREWDLEGRKERERRRTTSPEDDSVTNSPTDSESPLTPTSACLEAYSGSRFLPGAQVTVINGNFTQSGNMYNNTPSRGNTTTITTVNSYNKYSVVREMESKNPRYNLNPFMTTASSFNEVYA